MSILEVFVVDRDIDLRPPADRDGRGAGVDAPLAFGRGDALDAVDAAFELQFRKHPLPAHRRNDFLVTAHFGLVRRDDFDLPPLPVGEAAVHAQQIAREQRRLVSAGPGADFEHRGARVGDVLGQ